MLKGGENMSSKNRFGDGNQLINNSSISTTYTPPTLSPPPSFIAVADISLFAYDGLLNLNNLVENSENHENDFYIELPNALINFAENDVDGFKNLLVDINPEISKNYLNDVVDFLGNSRKNITIYEAGSENDFDNLPEGLMRQLVGKIFHKSSDIISPYHISYYYQVLHALEIGEINSTPKRRTLFGFVRKFDEDVTKSTDLLNNTTISILDSAKRGIIYCHDGFNTVGETLYRHTKKIKAYGQDTYEIIFKHICEYYNRKSRLIKYYFSDEKHARGVGIAILCFSGIVIAAIFSDPILVKIGTLLSGSQYIHDGIIFVIDDKKDLEKIDKNL